MRYAWYSVKLWFRERPEKLAWWVANHLPRKVALLAFVRVYANANTTEAPGPEYCKIYKAWERA